MNFTSLQMKGIAKFLVAENIDPQKLRFHISVIEPGTMSHPPHTHDGIEAFYVFEGNGAVEMEGETQAIGANEAILIDPSRPHGLVNTGSSPLRYLVILSQ
jgi:mannose-6-phosphate isomerase-like protein (cupin superfamily)